MRDPPEGLLHLTSGIHTNQSLNLGDEVEREVSWGGVVEGFDFAWNRVIVGQNWLKVCRVFGDFNEEWLGFALSFDTRNGGWEERELWCGLYDEVDFNAEMVGEGHYFSGFDFKGLGEANFAFGDGGGGFGMEDVIKTLATGICGFWWGYGGGFATPAVQHTVAGDAEMSEIVVGASSWVMVLKRGVGVCSHPGVVDETSCGDDGVGER